jgi:UDP-2-acetamido-3-amino-2,3-dideoxy-glucuronate N-acetyltransferase
MANKISEKSVVNEFVKLGDNVKIGHFCVIEGSEENPIEIGNHVEIGNHCCIQPNVKLNDNVMLANYVNLGSHIEIGKGSKIWYYCNIYGTKDNPTTIGENTQIGGYSTIKYACHIGNNCRFQSHIFVAEYVDMEDYVFVGPGVSFAVDKHPTAQAAIEGNWKLDGILVKKHVVIGSEAIINPGVNLGTGSIIGTGAVITKDTEDYGVYLGIPAKKVAMRSDEKFKNNFGLPSK